MFSILLDVYNKYQDTISITIFDFPISSHSESFRAAIVAECARRQNKYWEMADTIYANQMHLSPDLYDLFVADHELEISSFNQCISSLDIIDNISLDYQLGLEIGVTGTPYLIINDHPIAGLISFSEIIYTLDNTTSSSTIAP